MLKTFRNLAIVAVAVVGLAAASSAKADPVDHLTLSFASGATFSGDVEFAPDYSSVESVTGTLTGYQYGTAGFTGSGSDTIDWVWDSSINQATPSIPGDIYGTFLMDGPPNSSFGGTGYYNWIDLTYDFTGAPTLIFDNSPDDLLSGGYLPNGVDGSEDYVDPMVGGEFTPVVTPEPSSLWLLGSGLVGFAGMVRRKIGSRG